MNKNYWIKKKGKKGEIIWRKGRAQGLEGAKGRIGDISEEIKEILRKKKHIKVLEIGAGFGRALLELKQIFGDKIEVFGTNYEKEWNQKLTQEYALNQKFSKKYIPKIYIKIDAGKKLPFKNNSFDFVFCQATMQYILDRAFFIEEVNRILTKEGIGILELQEYRSDHPKEYENLIEIWDNGKKIDFLEYLKKFKNIQIKKSKGRGWHYLIMKKTKNLKLRLKLVHFIDLEKDIYSGWWGKKVIYIKK
jgi:ubiquinone/menaquinone biosynthesis C-methylase UbiE